MVVQKTQLVEFFVDHIHYMLRDRPVFESFTKLLLNSIFVLLFQTQLLMTKNRIFYEPHLHTPASTAHAPTVL